MIAERIRDKIAAAGKGMWMGGVPFYGYRVENRKLLVDDKTAAHVRWIFASFLEIGSCTELAREVGARGIRTPRGNRIDKKYLYRLLNNRVYIGEAVHKGDSLSGRARGHHRPGALGKGSCHPARKSTESRRPYPRRDAGTAERAAVRPGRCRLLADAHAQGRPALPLLCQPDRVEAGPRRMPCRPGPGG